MTQLDVAKQIEVTPSYISQVENARIGISLRGIRKLAGFYEVMPNQILNDAGQPEFDWLLMLTTPAPAEPELDSHTDPFSDLSPEERQELLTYLTFIRWRKKTTEASSATNEPQRAGS